jgi:hypothetical protein
LKDEKKKIIARFLDRMKILQIKTRFLNRSKQVARKSTVETIHFQEFAAIQFRLFCLKLVQKIRQRARKSDVRKFCEKQLLLCQLNKPTEI